MTDLPLIFSPSSVQAKRKIDLSVPDGVELRPIPSLSDHDKYFAGSDGHVYCMSDARVNAGKPKPFRLSETPGSEGYPFVAICLNGKRQSIQLHRLICEAFHGPKPSPEMLTRHLDGDKMNSLPGNLAWGTYAENEADKRRHGRAAAGERHGQVKLTEDAVRIIRASIPFGLWNTRDASEVFGVDPSTINRVAAGKRDWKDVK